MRLIPPTLPRHHATMPSCPFPCPLLDVILGISGNGPLPLVLAGPPVQLLLERYNSTDGSVDSLAAALELAALEHCRGAPLAALAAAALAGAGVEVVEEAAAQLQLPSDALAALATEASPQPSTSTGGRCLTPFPIRSQHVPSSHHPPAPCSSRPPFTAVPCVISQQYALSVISYHTALRSIKPCVTRCLLAPPPLSRRRQDLPGAPHRHQGPRPVCVSRRALQQRRCR